MTCCGGDLTTINQDYPTSFTVDPAKSYTSFGVFIGINKYPNLPLNQLYGCVNDAHCMADLFTGPRFNIQRYVVLTDEAATRAGISKALHELVQQVRIATTKTKDPITVVMTYSGHGSRLARIHPDPTLPGLDATQTSTWVAADSDENGSADIRGEELFLVHTALARLGTQVIMFSDSCHSGTAYRTIGPMRREIVRESPGFGPTDDLFSDFGGIASPSRAANADEIPGFVWYSACSNSETVAEDLDSMHNPCGPLTNTVRKLLAASSDTTYQGLYNRILEMYVPTYGRHPQMHAGFGKADKIFFEGKADIPHAEIIEQGDREVTLSMGLIDGIEEGTKFRFYEGATDARARRNSIATGTATASISPARTIVMLPENVVVPRSAWGIPDVTHFDQFTVALDGEIPPHILSRIIALVKDKRLVIAGAHDRISTVISYNPADKSVAMYLPSCLPPTLGNMSQSYSATPPRPLFPKIAVPGIDPEKEASDVTNKLLYMARVHALFSLDHKPSNSPVLPNLPAGTPPIEATLTDFPLERTSGGIVSLATNDRCTLHIVNNTNKAFYITLLTYGLDGRPQIVYPSLGEDSRQLVTGVPLDIRFRATIDTPNPQSGQVETTQIKILATEDEIDFLPLTFPPEVRSRSASKASTNPLFNLVRDAADNGSFTRGAADFSVDDSKDWGTLNIIFDVVQPKSH